MVGILKTRAFIWFDKSKQWNIDQYDNNFTCMDMYMYYLWVVADLISFSRKHIFYSSGFEVRKSQVLSPKCFWTHDKP